MPTHDQGCGRLCAAWEVLAQVPDPEVPAISLVELGIVRDLLETADGLDVVLTPTYSGCPATEAIQQQVREALSRFGTVTVTMRRAPAWTTDWITPEGREKLRAYGIAPPGRVHREPGAAGQGADSGGVQAVPIRLIRSTGSSRSTGLSRPGGAAGAALPDPVACPRCGSDHTERLSAFGSTACKSLYRCLACREPFEFFKPL